MSFKLKQLRNNRVAVKKMEPNTIEYQIKGGKINNRILQSMMANGYAKKPQSKDNIDGYIPDKELSGIRAQVYHNPKTNHLVINHRGTKGMHDVFTDIGLMFNHKSGKRFQHGKAVTDSALRKYDPKNVTLSGHSLGHQIAKDANRNHEKETVSVNPAITPYDMLNTQKDHETIIRSKLDPISYLHTWSPFANNASTIDIDAKTYNAIEEHHSAVILDLGDRDVGV